MNAFVLPPATVNTDSLGGRAAIHSPYSAARTIVDNVTDFPPDKQIKPAFTQDSLLARPPASSHLFYSLQPIDATTRIDIHQRSRRTVDSQASTTAQSAD